MTERKTMSVRIGLDHGAGAGDNLPVTRGAGREEIDATEIPRFAGLRALRVLALLLAAAGLLLLQRAARMRDLPLVTAADMTPAMQFAPVRAVGVMAETARIHVRDGVVAVVSFNLRDNGGVLQAVAFGETARMLAENGALPGPGDLVAISGIIHFSPRYGPQVRLQAAEHVVVMESAPREPAP